MGKDSNGMAGKMCSRCGKNPRAAGHAWCVDCKAEKQQGYNTDRDQMLERRGVARGISLAVKFLREKIAGQALTGYQSAVAIERAMISTETAEVTERRAMIASTRPAQ
jgi:hypothetical protein